MIQALKKEGGTGMSSARVTERNKSARNIETLYNPFIPADQSYQTNPRPVNICFERVDLDSNVDSNLDGNLEAKADRISQLLDN